LLIDAAVRNGDVDPAIIRRERWEYCEKKQSNNNGFLQSASSRIAARSSDSSIK